MKLLLDHSQRLNLHALLGAQRADVAGVRAIWALQDKLSLTPEEERAIDLRREIAAGQERIVWNPALSIAPQEFEFNAIEEARMRTAIETWDGFGATSDRRWLEPVLEILFGVEKSAGVVAPH